MGNAYQCLNQYEEAIKQYSKVISIKSDYVDAYYNMGNAFQKINAIEDALSSYEATLKFNHSNPRIFYALSNLYLAKKIFDKGWDFFESRWAVPELNQKGIGNNKPPFLDTTIQNKNILLWSEQGVGDQVIYLTMLKSVLQTNNEFIVSIDPRLISIYKRSFDNVTFVSNLMRVDENQYDHHLPLGSLGYLFRKDLNAFNDQPIKNINSNPELTREFINKLKKGKQLCGISWESSNKNFGKEKSLSLEVLLPILKIPDTQYINLQYGDKENEINDANLKYGLSIRCMEGIDIFHDIDSLTSLIDACDFVITTSNITAHLAGSLGKKTFLIIADHRIWYWHDKDRQSLWYPSVIVYNKNELREIVNMLQ